MTQARPIPAKVRSLVVGSQADNEALAAARAIGRVLKPVKVGGALTAPTCAAPGPDAAEPELTVYRRRRVYTPAQEQQHRAQVRFCRARPWSLTARERNFLGSISRLHGNLTVAQGDKLAEIADRLDWEVRRA